MGVPRLAEVRCDRIHFEPGDRIMVRVFHPIDADDRRKLISTIQKWGL